MCFTVVVTGAGLIPCGIAYQTKNCTVWSIGIISWTKGGDGTNNDVILTWKSLTSAPLVSICVHTTPCIHILLIYEILFTRLKDDEHPLFMTLPNYDINQGNLQIFINKYYAWKFWHWPSSKADRL